MAQVGEVPLEDPGIQGDCRGIMELLFRIL